MKIKLVLLFIFLCGIQSLHAGDIPEKIQSFFYNLIYNDEDLDQFVSKNDLEKTNRLGIEYEGVKYKFLLGYDIDLEVKKEIAAGLYSYDLKAEILDDRFTRVIFTTPEDKSYKTFFFLDDELISPITYHTAKWENFTSKYFNFFVSDSTSLHTYSVDLLDSYVDNLLNLLRVGSNEKNLLMEKKINYVLCRNADEIKKLTGFDTRGIYILGFDEIITTYSCHFHELSHLLINFRLKNLPLYTLPFFQEGFAVSTGGRGGIARHILLDAGYYLHKSAFIPVNSILSRENFLAEDPSTSYAVAGIYSYYLLNSYGVEPFLKLYREYSGDFEKVNSLKNEMIILPKHDEFESFISGYELKSGVFINPLKGNYKLLHQSECCVISESDSDYKFEIRTDITLRDPEGIKGNYKSSRFKEIFPGIDYNNSKYAVSVKRNEVSIYNLYTNILISSYYAGLTENNLPVPGEGELFEFYISKDVFEENLKTMIISVP